MRFIREYYQDLADGYQLTCKLDIEFKNHPAYIAWQKRQAIMRKKRLQRMSILTAFSWATIPLLCLISFASFVWDTSLSRSSVPMILFAGFIAVASTLYTVGLALFNPNKKPRSVSQQWWNTISTNRLPSHTELCAQFVRNGNEDIKEYTEYGAKGVWQTLGYVNRKLNDGWFALTNVMISRAEDADLILVGPSGIWVMESKYWSGYINIENNRWSRVRVYYERGGHRKSEYMHINKPWDAQWIRQRGAVVHIISEAKVSFSEHSPSDLVLGGIVLSHPAARLNADGSQRANIGNLAYWLGQMQQSQNTERLSFQDRLRIVDTLLTVTRRNQKERYESRLAVPLANQIFKEIMTETIGRSTKDGAK